MLNENKEQGFTVVELTVVMLVFLIVMSLVLVMFSGFNGTTSATEAFLHEEGQLYDVIDELDTEVREAIIPSPSPGTNVLLPQSSVAAMGTTLSFYIDTNGAQQPIMWNIAIGANPATSYLQRAIGSGPPSAITWQPSVNMLNNVVAAQFCYVDASGENMTGANSCPGTKTSATFTVNQIVTCSVAVFIQIQLQSSYAKGPLFASIGVGLRNQNSQLLSEGAIEPNGTPAAC
jgi:type II secretory pathway pseudopilin PulG